MGSLNAGTSTTLMARNAFGIASEDPAGIREKFCTPEYVNAFCDGFFDRLKAGKRDAQRLYLEVLRIVGPQPQVAIILNQWLAEFGVRDKSEIVRALELTRNGSNMSVEECELEAVALLRYVFAEKPERRFAVLSALAGREIAHENGHANGLAQNGDGE